MPPAVRAGGSIDYAHKAPDGLVGNGTSMVRVRPDGFEFLEGGDAAGRFRLVIDGQPFDLKEKGAGASFFPGGVSYHLRVRGLEVDVLHGATAELVYVATLRVRNARGRVELEVDAKGMPALGRSVRLPIALHAGRGEIAVAAGTVVPQASWARWRKRFEAPYLRGLVLHTPDPLIDRAVPFNRFLIDLGFNGRLHVCELFRWRDVWSRDLGSGLAPGALVNGSFAAARTTIEYDLRRYAAARPSGLKVTEDPSQGGSAEGVAWLARAVWRDYLLSGDRDFLRRSTTILRPWVEAWLARDADERGTLIDTTEWMDHSRFLLFPDGARVLYSNALFVGLLETFAKFEAELGDTAASRRFATVRERFVRGVNSQFWNERSGSYDNLALWGKRDERSSSDGNMLAILNGVVPAERVPRVLAAIAATNWRTAGSVTITPPMTHVDLNNDHNFKVWPWWNAVEARARLRHGDIDGGIRLLETFSETLAIEEFPGMVEELMTPDGVSEGGHAFVSAAGAYQDAIFEGLLGIEVLAPGRARLRVAPNVPSAWHDWSAQLPLPGGVLMLRAHGGRLSITVTDPAVHWIEAPATATVRGAVHAALITRDVQVPADLSAPTPLSVPAPRARHVATFGEPGLPAPRFAGLPARRVGADDLATLDPAEVGALVLPGNALPRHTKAGVDLVPALTRYLDRGGAIVFFGATMHDRQTMGEHGGVIDWYEYRPRIDYTPIDGWTYRASPDDGTIAQPAEYGLQHGWQQVRTEATGWSPMHLPRRPQDHPPTRYTAWEWFRAGFALPQSARGKPVVVSMGRVNHRDWTYVNGVLVGSGAGKHEFRAYRIEPGDPAYATLVFGGRNQLAAQVVYGGEDPGPWADVPTIGVENADLAWMPTAAKNGEVLEHPQRYGVQSWGPGDFFASWETSRGAFGFRLAGRGIEFVGPLQGLAALDLPTQVAFTDFAVSSPWQFQALAYTRTARHLLVPDDGERYPAAARLINRATGGEIVLIPLPVADSVSAPDLLQRLGMD